MAKDQLGHGSNPRGTGAQGMRLVKTHTLGPHSAKVYKNPDWNENVVKFFQNGTYQSKADYHTDDMSDAHSTAGVALQRYADLDVKAALSNGPKSAPAPVHDSMRSPGQSDASYITQRLTANAGKTVGMERGEGESDKSYITRRVSGPAPVHDSMTHNAQGHAWGSPEALADFKAAYGRGKAAGNAKNQAEGKAFRSGKSEINRLRKQGK